MKEETKLVDDLLEKLLSEIPAKVRKSIPKHQHHTLKKIMKEQAGYSAFAGLVLSFLYFLKKFGVSLSLVQGKIILMTFSIAAVTSVTAASFFAIKSIPPVFSDPEKTTINSGSFNAGSGGEKVSQISRFLVPVPSSAPVHFKNSISLEKFNTENKSNELSVLFYSLEKELVKRRGTSTKKAAVFLKGSLLNNNGYELYLRGIKNNGEIVYSASFNSETLNGLLRQVPVIVRNINRGIE